jgi:hypothetical protein
MTQSYYPSVRSRYDGLMKRRAFAVIALSLGIPYGAAHAQDASLTVYLRVGAASTGAFNQTSSTATQVHVFARSSRSAMYNSSANLYAPTGVKVLPGGTFSLQIPNLYSNAKYSHNYTLELSWPDTTTRTLTYGPFPIAPGSNNYGLGGLGSTAPIEVSNTAPPLVTQLNCYPDLPDQSTQLYISWRSGTQPLDYNRTELHLSTTSGFVPSASTLVRMPPWGTTSQKLTGLMPQTSYYYCIRTLDEYLGSSDACSTAACTTAAPGMTVPDAGTGGGSDAGSGPGSDAGSGSGDGGTDPGPGPGPGSDSDGGQGNIPVEVGSVAVGCGCSLVASSAAPGWLAMGPALLLLLRRRRRATGARAGSQEG